MKRGVWIAIAVGIVLILVGVVVILMFVPFGPALSVIGPGATITSTELADGKTPAIEVTVVPAESECGSGVMSFMALGESQPPRGADAIRLVRVDFDNKQITALSVPSTLWVTTPGLSASGTGSTTLNDVYLQGKALVSGDDRARMLAAVNLFASTLQDNFGITPEHYFVIKQAAFSDFVDALNGVDVVLPAAVDGRAEGLNYYQAGEQHLSGAMALDLVRISAGGEWMRFGRQELIIQAVYDALLTPSNWVRLPAIMEAFQDNILTDLSVNQMMEISCILDQPGMMVNQEQVGSDMVIVNGQKMLPSPELGEYIREMVGK